MRSVNGAKRATARVLNRREFRGVFAAPPTINKR
jgi:hypothetical protein